MNKKALYESIMRNVAKQVKKALNEGENYQDEEFDETLSLFNMEFDDPKRSSYSKIVGMLKRVIIKEYSISHINMELDECSDQKTWFELVKEIQDLCNAKDLDMDNEGALAVYETLLELCDKHAPYEIDKIQSIYFNRANFKAFCKLTDDELKIIANELVWGYGPMVPFIRSRY